VLDPGSDPPAQSSPDPGGGGDTAPSSGSETNGEQGNGEATDARGVHASKAVTQRLTLWTHGGSRVWICKWMLPQLEYALESGGWDGRINEGWRSRATEELYWDKHGHDPGLAAPPGQSNHGLTVYPGGAIDVSDPRGLQRALRPWPAKLGKQALKLERPAMIGNGVMLPRDTVHFSVTGR
jgi:hypothetical protein